MSFYFLGKPEGFSNVVVGSVLIFKVPERLRYFRSVQRGVVLSSSERSLMVQRHSLTFRSILRHSEAFLHELSSTERFLNILRRSLMS